MSSPTFISDITNQMRIVLGRRNENDPDSSDPTMIKYLNQFISTMMPHDVKLFENFGTLTFIIDENTTTIEPPDPPDPPIINGTITLEKAGLQGGIQFANLSMEAYISLLEPEHKSVSWNYLPIYQDPGQFFGIWGINNEKILIPGYPTDMLYYGNEFTFRTIPDKSYLVKIFGYKRTNTFPTSITGNDEEDIDGNPVIPFEDWARYLLYGACSLYVRDFRYDAETKSNVLSDFAHERKLMLTHTHNQIKQSRAMPRF